jgi:hypothetical protein
MAKIDPAGGKHDGVLATVKVWPVYAGARGKGGATANLDGVCARRHRAAMPGKDREALLRHRLS